MRPAPRRWVTAATVAAVTATCLTTAAASAPASDRLSTTVAGINVDTATIPQLERAMNAHRLTAVQLVQFYLHRIDRLNPRLHAVIAVDPDALREARTADERRRHGDRGPLLGIPVMLKDNIDTADMVTTAGSLALLRHRPDDQAFIVDRLKAAGALIIGKANLSEWANFRSSSSSSGWSAVGGQTNSPYVLDRNPCGSSSGPGVAAAADLATVAVGTETDGSIVCPSGTNGDVGIKPSLGLVSRTGIVPISEQQDTAGPITRNVTDAAVLLGVLHGYDPADPVTKAAQSQPADYTQFLDRTALRHARIGIWRAGNFGISEETDAVMNAAIARLQSLGATVVDNTDIPYLDQVYAAEGAALNSEFKHDIAVYLATRPGDGPKTLADLIAFNDNHASQELKYFGQDVFLAAEQAPPITDPTYLKERQTATSLAQRGIDETMAKYHLTAILAPTNGPAWTTDLINGDHFSIGSSTPAAVAGYGAVTVPAGSSFGLPIGMSLIGGRFSEPTLIGLAYAWEQATHLRHAPRFLPTVPADTSGQVSIHRSGDDRGHQGDRQQGRVGHQVVAPNGLAS